MMYKEFIQDFIKRTKENYEKVKDGPYEVTQLINSAIGLLIIPKEYEKANESENEKKMKNRNKTIQISDDFVDESLLNKMISCVDDKYKNNLDLAELVRHLRNGIAHSRIDFMPGETSLREPNNHIGKVIIEDRDKDKGKIKGKINFKIDLPIDLLKEFFMEFSDGVIKYCENHK